MKKLELNKKLSLKKDKITNLNDLTGGDQVSRYVSYVNCPGEPKNICNVSPSADCTFNLSCAC